ncbi:MAG: hypothetical protein CMJ81_00415 [Planctomycetaceae bacterium]|nr:hypothetical protein [Planctomycetaceae bacterium]MBP60956.1 hypothetical protein [Planctomycetaceae bacterium]
MQGDRRSFIPANYWIFSPLKDGILILLTPFVVMLVFAATGHYQGQGLLIGFGLVLSAGHYLPGMLRAYGDPALFRRYRLRLIVAPILLMSLCATFTYLNLHAFMFLMLLWGSWHWMMQVYGFGRIYDAKAKSFSKTTARFDHAMCILWFYWFSIFSYSSTSYLSSYYTSGGPFLPAQLFHYARHIWLAMALAVSAAYVIHLIRLLRQGQSINPLKIIFFSITLPYLGYAMAVVETPLLGYILFEACHDIQYLAIVWFVNRKRAENGSDAGSFIQFLFRPRLLLVVLYIAVCLAFGSMAIGKQLSDSDGFLMQVFAVLIATSATYHYYLDGFIWKVRETSMRRSLGVSESEGELHSQEVPETRQVLSPALRHSSLWLLLFVPAAILGVLEHNAPEADNVDRSAKVAAKVAEAFPYNADAQIVFCGMLIDRQQAEKALTSCHRAASLRPNWALAHMKLGHVFLMQDKRDKAISAYRDALELNPESVEARFNLGVVLVKSQNWDQAARAFEGVLRLKPQHSQAHHNLAITHEGRNQIPQAEEHYKQALRINPDFTNAHVKLGSLYAEQKKFTQAEHHLAESMRLKPSPKVRSQLNNVREALSEAN